MKENRILRFFRSLIIIFLGTAIYAFGIYAFTAPNQIAPGGITGLATVVNDFTGFPIGAMVTIFNVPLLLIGFKMLGKEFLFHTLFSTVFFNLQMDYLYPLLPVYEGNKLLAAIFGGVFIGIGLAVVFMSGGSTGGTDIICRIVQKKKPHISLGTIVFISDLIVISIAALAYQSIESALYAVIAMFVSTKAIDGLIYGANVRKLIFIVSEQSEEISKIIAHDLYRGCTLLHGKGAYTGEKKEVVLCACKTSEFYKLKHMVRRIDPKAFMVVTDSGEVFGEGFSAWNK